MNELLKNLPKVDEILRERDVIQCISQLGRDRVMSLIRHSIGVFRTSLITNPQPEITRGSLREDICKLVTRSCELQFRESYQRVINATGVVIHTNLGRAPLSEAVLEKVCRITAGYTNLEYSVVSGSRSNRLRYIENMLIDITGAEAALVVNNNAAAVMLALNTWAKDREIILSRGEIVEIGDSFRINEIIETSGCYIKEVGTTNRTSLRDYEKALTPETAMLLKVHTSNYRVVGFTESVSSQSLLTINTEALVMEDMGSGVFIDLTQFDLPYERRVQDAVADGVDIITFSGDKMLGGPQAGIIVGKKKYIDAMKKNQLLRCLRLDKMCLAALEATLNLYIHDKYLEIPVIHQIAISSSELEKKAHILLKRIQEIAPHLEISVAPHVSQFGGGTLPAIDIKSYGVWITTPNPNKVIDYLRVQRRPIIALIEKDSVILDMRTLSEEDYNPIVNAFASIPTSF